MSLSDYNVFMSDVNLSRWKPSKVNRSSVDVWTDCLPERANLVQDRAKDMCVFSNV